MPLKVRSSAVALQRFVILLQQGLSQSNLQLKPGIISLNTVATCPHVEVGRYCVPETQYETQTHKCEKQYINTVSLTVDVWSSNLGF